MHPPQPGSMAGCSTHSAAPLRARLTTNAPGLVCTPPAKAHTPQTGRPPPVRAVCLSLPALVRARSRPRKFTALLLSHIHPHKNKPDRQRYILPPGSSMEPMTIPLWLPISSIDLPPTRILVAYRFCFCHRSALQ